MDLNQITIPATNMEDSIRFYETIGFRLIVHTHDRYARFEAPMGSTTLSLHQSDRPGAGDIMLYFEVSDVTVAVHKLKESGIKFDTQVQEQRWLWTEARLKDPAGNSLCIYHAGQNRRFPPWRKSESPA